MDPNMHRALTGGTHMNRMSNLLLLLTLAAFANGEPLLAGTPNVPTRNLAGSHTVRVESSCSMYVAPSGGIGTINAVSRGESRQNSPYPGLFTPRLVVAGPGRRVSYDVGFCG